MKANFQKVRRQAYKRARRGRYEAFITYYHPGEEQWFSMLCVTARKLVMERAILSERGVHSVKCYVLPKERKAPPFFPVLDAVCNLLLGERLPCKVGPFAKGRKATPRVCRGITTLVMHSLPSLEHAKLDSLLRAIH